MTTTMTTINTPVPVIQQIVQTFAEIHHFIQKGDIDRIKKEFDRRPCGRIYGPLIDGKKCIYIEDENENDTKIVLGKTNLVVEDVEDEEIYFIQRIEWGSIRIADFSDKDALMDAIQNEYERLKTEKRFS